MAYMLALTQDDTVDINDIDALTKAGKAILEDKSKVFGVVILSGGDGTRLGFKKAKCLYKIDGKSLFEYHLDRLRKIYETYKSRIFLFLMTNSRTNDEISAFLKTLDTSFLEGVDLVDQSDEVALDIASGLPLMLDGKKITNPRGNGDFFDTIKKSQNFNKVCLFNVTSIDNVLASLLDEAFVASFFKYDLDVLSKAIKPRNEEKVGLFCKEDGKLVIKEYGEVEKNDKIVKNGFANICNHIFSKEFVRRVDPKSMPYHDARKVVSYDDINGVRIDPKIPNAIKKELFIFDSFIFTQKNKILVVDKNKEFSPLKNSLDSEFDNEKTCLESLRINGLLNK